MVCYAMLPYAMVWYGMHGMLLSLYAMRFVCYAMIYVLKDLWHDFKTHLVLSITPITHVYVCKNSSNDHLCYEHW